MTRASRSLLYIILLPHARKGEEFIYESFFSHRGRFFFERHFFPVPNRTSLTPRFMYTCIDGLYSNWFYFMSPLQLDSQSTNVACMP